MLVTLLSTVVALLVLLVARNIFDCTESAVAVGVWMLTSTMTPENSPDDTAASTAEGWTPASAAIAPRISTCTSGVNEYNSPASLSVNVTTLPEGADASAAAASAAAARAPGAASLAPSTVSLAPGTVSLAPGATAAAGRGSASEHGGRAHGGSGGRRGEDSGSTADAAAATACSASADPVARPALTRAAALAPAAGAPLEPAAIPNLRRRRSCLATPQALRTTQQRRATEPIHR